jgi:hypothetical protein
MIRLELNLIAAPAAPDLKNTYFPVLINKTIEGDKGF